MTSHGYAEWRGRKQQAITLHIPMTALLAFVGQMRLKPRPEAVALDSRTYQADGPNPWKGGRHVRNGHYLGHIGQRGQGGGYRDE